MAFHPFRTFTKNKKFWMAMATLMCMVTFVLCTGVGGDLSDRLLSWFRPRGKEIAKVDGRSYYFNEMQEIRTQRNIANEFMRKATQYAIMRIEEEVKARSTAPEPEKQKQVIGEMETLKMELMDRLKRPRYFDGGTKLDELVDFIIWK